MNSSPIATANVRHPRLLLDRLIGTGRTKAMVQNDRVRDPVHADENIVTIAVESFRSVVLTTSQSLYRVQDHQSPVLRPQIPRTRALMPSAVDSTGVRILAAGLFIVAIDMVKSILVGVPDARNID
ncbi:hypothetical protein CCMA1212_001986 [Trichoderma ghanense]|uniref:Uncharacterized protein n=1 Tax=Trichoderma ghanense TaxID=65468 RepID=A0ABY2HEV8_9HYPO